MTWAEYVPLAIRTEGPPFLFKCSLSLHNTSLSDENLAHSNRLIRSLHAVMGMVTEACDELLRTTDRDNVIEELGDFSWYMALYCDTWQLPDLGRVVWREYMDACTEWVHITDWKDGVKQLSIHVGQLTDVYKRALCYRNGEVEDRHVHLIKNIYSIWVQLWGKVEEGEPAVDVLAKNIAKLQARYPDKFDAVKAVNRNIGAETESMQNCDEDRKDARI